MAGLKSVSLTFQSPTRVNKDPCRYSFNFRDRKDCSCRSWNRECKVLQNFLRANGRDSFSGDKSFMYGKSTANQVKIMPTNFSYCAWLHICSWLLAWRELKRVRDSRIAQLQLVFSYPVYKKFCLQCGWMLPTAQFSFFARYHSFFQECCFPGPG